MITITDPEILACMRLHQQWPWLDRRIVSVTETRNTEVSAQCKQERHVLDAMLDA
jgi:hypothetical protein